MEGGASDAFERGTPTPNLTLVYLLRSDEEERGIYAFEVLDIVNADNGKVYYHSDPRLHRWRVGILLGDVFLMFSTGILCLRLAKRSSRADDAAEDWVDPEGLRAMPSGLTSIHLTDAESSADGEK
jgi:hypothetical protein